MVWREGAVSRPNAPPTEALATEKWSDLVLRSAAKLLLPNARASVGLCKTQSSKSLKSLP